MNQLEAETIADWQKVGVRNATPVRDGWLVTLRDGHSCFVPNNESRHVPASSIEPAPAMTPTEPAPALTSEEIMRPVPKLGNGDCEELEPPPVDKTRSTMFSLPEWDPSEVSQEVSDRVRALKTFAKCDCVLEMCSFDVIEGQATHYYYVTPDVPAVVDYVIVSRSVLVDDFTIGNIRPFFASQAKGIPGELFDYLTLERQIVPEARPDLAGMDGPPPYYSTSWQSHIIQNVVYPGIQITATIRNPSPVAKRISALLLGRLIEI